MNPLIQFNKQVQIYLTLALVCLVLPSTMQAANPPGDGDVGGANTAEGSGALFHLTTGTHNTALGGNTLYSLTTGGQNTATGSQALNHNIADRNTADGFQALFYNSTGTENTATGWRALYHNTISNHVPGGFNTAAGSQALYSNTTGRENTANGQAALFSNTTGGGNTATGIRALRANTDGSDNVATGADAMINNRTGSQNTATGTTALDNNVSGFGNTATGNFALDMNTTGSNNTADGAFALLNSNGSNNTALGEDAGNGVTTADNVICIGYNVGGANVSNTTWVGNIYGVTTQSGTAAPVIVSDTGQLGTIVSSERFKKDIANMDKVSQAILSLRPVTFHYKTDTKGIPQFGLIAEEVAKVNPGLVLPDKEGKPYTVRYEAVNAMLLNEFLKEHRRVEQLEKQVEALTVAVQKVSAQVEVSKPAPQTACLPTVALREGGNNQ
jgi:hypothetical protein